jgi:hypothetical protein
MTTIVNIEGRIKSVRRKNEHTTWRAPNSLRDSNVNPK